METLIGQQAYNPHLKKVLKTYQLSAVKSLQGPSTVLCADESVTVPKKKSVESSPEPFVTPPPLPIQQLPILTTPDRSRSERSETVLEGESISCFVVGGEKRLCLPQILNSVLRDFSLPQINQVCDELQIFCSRCNPDQLEVLKFSGILPSSAPSCGLITKTDAERLCSALLHHWHPPPTILDKSVSLQLKVYHECFGKCKGLCMPELYTDSNARCIECTECRGLFSPQTFVCHAHRNLEVRTCHWGFDSSNWRSYLLLVEDQPDSERGEKLLELFKKQHCGTETVFKRKQETSQGVSGDAFEGLNMFNDAYFMEVDLNTAGTIEDNSSIGQYELFTNDQIKRLDSTSDNNQEVGYVFTDTEKMVYIDLDQSTMIANQLKVSERVERVQDDIKSEKDEDLSEMSCKKPKLEDNGFCSPTTTATASVYLQQSYDAFHYYSWYDTWARNMSSAFRPWPAMGRQPAQPIHRDSVPTYLNHDPPVLLHPERVVPLSQTEHFERSFQPNVALAPPARRHDSAPKPEVKNEVKEKRPLPPPKLEPPCTPTPCPSVTSLFNPEIELSTDTDDSASEVTTENTVGSVVEQVAAVLDALSDAKETTRQRVIGLVERLAVRLDRVEADNRRLTEEKCQLQEQLEKHQKQQEEESQKKKSAFPSPVPEPPAPLPRSSPVSVITSPVSVSTVIKTEPQ